MVVEEVLEKVLEEGLEVLEALEEGLARCQFGDSSKNARDLQMMAKAGTQGDPCRPIVSWRLRNCW